MAGTCRNRRNHVKLNRAKNGGVWATGAFYDIVRLFQERAAGGRESTAPAAIPDKTGKSNTQGGCDPAGAWGEHGPWLPRKLEKQTKSNENA